MTIDEELSFEQFLFAKSEWDFKKVCGHTKEEVQQLSCILSSPQKNVGRKCKFSPLQRTLLILFHLRHFVVDAFLAFAVRQSTETVRRVYQSALGHLYQHYQSRISVALRCPGERYWDTMFSWVIDGSEQEIQQPGHAILNTKFYSAKKGHHSINILAICDFDGRILWVSNSYAGSWTDVEIVKRELRQFLSQIPEEEKGLGDKGFNGLYSEYSIFSLNFKRNDQNYKELAHFRVQIENCFARVQKYRALKYPLRQKCSNAEQEQALLEMHQKRFVVAVGLTNQYYKGKWNQSKALV